MMSTDLIKRWWRDESGQDLVEYTLLLAFVTLASTALLQMNTEAVGNIWTSAMQQLKKAEKGPGL